MLMHEGRQAMRAIGGAGRHVANVDTEGLLVAVDLLLRAGRRQRVRVGRWRMLMAIVPLALLVWRVQGTRGVDGDGAGRDLVQAP